MVGGNHHSVHPHGTLPFILNRDLRLAVGAKEIEGAVAAATSQLLREAMSESDGQGHERIGFVAGHAEHQALIAGAARVHSHGDVGRLLFDRDQHRATIGVEAAVGIGVTDSADGLAGNGGKIDVGTGGDFTRDQNHAGGYQGFARHPSGGVALQHGVEDGVGDLIADFVGMAFGH